MSDQRKTQPYGGKTPVESAVKTNEIQDLPAASVTLAQEPRKKRKEPKTVSYEVIRRREERRIIAAKVFAVLAPISAFVLGQVAMWIVYAKTGYALLLTELRNAAFPNVKDLTAVIIYSPIWGGVATGLIAYTGWYLTDMFAGWKAFWILLVFCLMMLIAPGVLWTVALIYSIVMICVKDALC